MMDKSCLILFFDGECRFCVGWVRFLLDRDANHRLRFAHLQGAWAHRFFESQGHPHPGPDSLVVWDNGQVRTASDAILAISGALPGAWNLFKYGRIVPKALRDQLYALIAERRYRLFGRYDQCWVPAPEERRKFLDLASTEAQHVAHGTEAGHHPDSDKRARHC